MLKIPPYIRVLASTLAIVALLLACVLSFHNMLSKALRGEAERRSRGSWTVPIVPAT